MMNKNIDSVTKYFSVMYIKYSVANLSNDEYFYLENNEYYFCSISIICRAAEIGSALQITHLMYKEIIHENEKRKKVSQL